MLKIAVRRILGIIPLMLIVSFFVFVLVDLVPGDAATVLAGENATTEQIAQTRHTLGLDDPLLVRYWDWLTHAVRGDLGKSLYSSQTVVSTVGDRLPITGSLGLVAMVLVVLIGIPLGTAAAIRPNSPLDRTVSAIASLGMSMPPFVIGLVLALTFGIALEWFPATGYVPLGEGGLIEWLRHLILPALAIAAISAAELARQTRGSLVDTLQTDYIRTTRAKGLLERQIILKHAMRNAAIPIVTILGLQVGRILAGSVTVEFVFGLPGFGSLAVTAVNQRDLPVILGIVVVSALVVSIANLLVDLSYGYLNPRTRT